MCMQEQAVSRGLLGTCTIEHFDVWRVASRNRFRPRLQIKISLLCVKISRISVECHLHLLEVFFPQLIFLHLPRWSNITAVLPSYIGTLLKALPDLYMIKRRKSSLPVYVYGVNATFTQSVLVVWVHSAGVPWIVKKPEAGLALLSQGPAQHCAQWEFVMRALGTSGNCTCNDTL